MREKRIIRQNEKDLIEFLLNQLNLNPKEYPVDEYVDSDETPVVITLTKDDKGHLLDLDFWKVDFTKLLEYPTPDKIILRGNV